MMDEAMRLAERMLVDGDDIETDNGAPTCERCHDVFSLYDNAELCAFCDRCAALVAADLARALLALRPLVEAAEAWEASEGRDARICESAEWLLLREVRSLRGAR